MELMRHFVIRGFASNGSMYNIAVPATLSEEIVNGFAQMIKYAPSSVSNVICIKLTRELLHCGLKDAVDFVRDVRNESLMRRNDDCPY